MCHNHSHAKANLIGTVSLAARIHGIFQGTQPFTVETPGGAKLIRPAGSIFLMPFLTQEDWSAFLVLLTEDASASTLLSATSGLQDMDIQASSYPALLSALLTP